MAFVAMVAQAHRLHRARPDQEPDHRRAGDQPRALADAPLRAAPEPRLLPERLRRAASPTRSCRRRRRCANSVVQLIDAIWYAAVQWVGAAVIFAAADWRLLMPLIVWLAAYIGALLYFVPRIKERSTAAAEARSMLVGRIVDSYTNILTVKLFAHADREDAYARDALEEQMTKWQASLRLADVDGAGALHAERLPDRGRHGARHLAVEPRPRHHRRHRRRHRPRHAHRRHVGLDPVGRRRHLREHRRGAGGHGDDQPATTRWSTGRDSRPLAVRAGRDPLRGRELPLRPAASAPGTARRRRRHPRSVAASSRRARRSAWSAARAPASRRSSTCCCASTTWSRAAS